MIVHQYYHRHARVRRYAEALADAGVQVDVLCARDDVDADRVGCAGLSGGGLRTTYLAGTDPRIRCCACVGMMTTWRDCLLHKCHTHTWMIYIPLLPRELDYPEILGLRVPLPTLVQNNIDDELFTMPEMQRAVCGSGKTISGQMRRVSWTS